MRRRTTSHPVLAPLLFVAHAAKRVPRRWWLLFAIVAVTAVCFTDSATTHNTIRVRRKPAIQMAGYNAPMNDQTSRNLIENTVEALMNHSTVKVRAPGSLSGPLCVFVPTNLDDKEHELEMNAFLNTWADGSVTLFTESLTIGSMRKPNSHGTFVSLASQSRWNMAQARRILTQKKLRWRGATEDSIRGRGQLSIPLFRWMAELVQTDDPFVKNCKWFMKCDSDTYLRRGLLETALLNHLNHSKPYHVGVPLHFDTFPFNLTARLQFEYNIGGPGYTFSRGLLQSLDMLGCAQAMAEDPILLVHDDVATGYCATYHTREPSERIDVQNAISTSSFKLVDLIIDRAWASIRDPAQNTSTCSCLDAVVAMHPARPKYMYSLFSRHIGPKRINSTACIQSSLGDVANHHCHATLMYGNPPVVGDGFDIHPALEAMMKNWSNAAKLVSRVTSDLSAKAFRV